MKYDSKLRKTSGRTCAASGLKVKSIRRGPQRKVKQQRMAAYVKKSIQQTSAGYKNEKIWTSYGLVTMPVYNFGSGHYALQNSISGLDGNPLYVKCVDAQLNGISSNMQYSLPHLATRNPTVITATENNAAGEFVANAKKQHKPISLMKNQLVTLNSVDIHFLTNEYVNFMHTVLEINNINSDSVLVSVHNYPNMDNAFFTGTNMVYGNGGRMFAAMGKMDVVGHELAHGIVSTYSGLEYRGHSGALNESFSDVIGVAFEFWVYRKFNSNDDESDDLAGSGDWLMGEDVGSSIPYLRNMMEPTKADSPQPDTFQGKHWADPNNEQFDHGGVHINSGVTNKCFFLVSQNIGIFNALKLWFRTLKCLGPKSSFIVFRDTLKEQAHKKEIRAVEDALKVVGLTDDAVSAWRG